MKIRTFLTIFFLSFLVGQPLFAQELEIREIKEPTVCYAGFGPRELYIPPPQSFQKFSEGLFLRGENVPAIFEVEYIGFENAPAARDAYQFAVDIWSSLLQSKVPIRVRAVWTQLNQGVLGGAAPGAVVRNFNGAQKVGVFYPVALAEKMAGIEITGAGSIDIFSQFNSNVNWHFDPNTTPPVGHFDFVTVVLHEIGHGLGFFHTFSLVEGNQIQAEYGFLDTIIPIFYDTELQNGEGENILKTFPSPSNTIKTAIASNDLFYNSVSATDEEGELPKLYAPFSYNQGSSVSHLDETTYNDSDNALMTPQIDFRERIHDPGYITLGMFNDMGWRFIRIVHTQVPNSEDLDGIFEVKVKLEPDTYDGYGYQPEQVNLVYITNGLQQSETTIPMQHTGEPDEFVAYINGINEEAIFSYHISIVDTDDRTLTKPGKLLNLEGEDIQLFFDFTVGPDFEPPSIFHDQPPFIRAENESFRVEAFVTDNIGVDEVILEYSYNEEVQSPLLLTKDSNDEALFFVMIDLTAFDLQEGDMLSYRFIATDNSANQNNSIFPEEGFISVNVVALLSTQDSYENDFNTLTDHFFGSNFRIEQPEEFNDPAIHSDHPYLNGTGPNFESNYTYQLRVPIRIADENAVFTFDEIVLVEPGDAGAVFGSSNFWDYVIVEGSRDGGVSWIPLIDGYDSRDRNVWLTHYNSSMSGMNSTAVGEPSLFRKRIINLLNTFEPEEVVVFRFRLFADQLANGWGWAIDNLKIQIDESPPVILHNHLDYLDIAADEIFIQFIVEEDPSGIEAISIDYFFNNDEQGTMDIPYVEGINEYTLTLSLQNPLSESDVFKYRIRATDNAGNENLLPGSDYFVAPVLFATSPINSYVNDFNTSSDDFIGNFFSIYQSSNFLNPSIHSSHPYPNGFGLGKTSNFTYTLKHPIIFNSSNPFIVFDEIAIIESGVGNSPFGTDEFNDYVIVEGSIDGGREWFPFLEGYDSREQNIWRTVFIQNGFGLPGMFRTRFLKMNESHDFLDGDQIFVRFRLFSNEANNGWGWAIDNIQIQGPITSVEDTQLDSNAIQLYPNPANQNVHLKIELPGFSGKLSLIVLDMMGKPRHKLKLEVSEGKAEALMELSAMPAGQYLIRAQTEKFSMSKKLMVIK